eukprot:COSAG04_NODE_1066_length_8488_cov_2.933246_5_plen_181_part_01
MYVAVDLIWSSTAGESGAPDTSTTSSEFICEMETGDGIGGTETQIGDAASPQACAQMVRRTQPDANGATYSNTGGMGCYAEFGMTGANSDTNWRTCRFPEAAKVCDFEVGDGVGRGGAGGSEVGPLIISGVSRGAVFLTPTAPCFRPTSARRTTRGAASTVCVNSSQARTVQRFQLSRFAP